MLYSTNLVVNGMTNIFSSEGKLSLKHIAKCLPENSVPTFSPKSTS